MVSFAPEEKVSVTYGFDPAAFGGDEEVAEVKGTARPSLAPTRGSVPLSYRNPGLGKNLGGQLTRSALGGAAYEMLDPAQKARQIRYEIPVNTLRQLKVTRLPANAAARFAHTENTPRPWTTTSLDAGEPQGMFYELLLSDQSWAREQTFQEDLHAVCEHRWTFPGALELAKKGRSFCFFVRCLLDMQRNVQIEEDGSALSPDLVNACALFVNGQCNRGCGGDMYEILTHFISNAIVFEEWDKYLRDAFESSRSQEESFLVPHLEQVWGRFRRMVDALEDIFRAVNSKFVCFHRLPAVGDLLNEHMKRRCFTRDCVTRNYMFMQEKCTNATVKDIKHAFQFG